MSHFFTTATGERDTRALTLLLIAGFLVIASAGSARADTGDSYSDKARTAMILAEHGSSGKLGATAEWAWAQRLEREMCARYRDTSCSG